MRHKYVHNKRMSETGSAPKYPRTIVVMDTESMGLANYQQDSSRGFGVFQISALKFEMAADGSLKLLDHLDMVVNPDKEIKFLDPRKGARNRQRFYEDYQTLPEGKPSVCFKAYRQVFEDPKIGFNSHYFYHPRYRSVFGHLPAGAKVDSDDTPGFRPYLGVVNSLEDADALRSRFKRNVKTELKKRVKTLTQSLADPEHQEELSITSDELGAIKRTKLFDPQKETTMMVYEYLNYQVFHYQKLAQAAKAAGNDAEAKTHAAKAEEICELRKQMCKELISNPWSIEQIDEAHGASKAMGLPNEEKLLAKAFKVNGESNNGAPLGYVDAAKRFTAFCAGSDSMVAHNAMFDYAIMHRLYEQARDLEKKKPKEQQTPVPDFPFDLHQVSDTLAMAASQPSRLGHKNRLDNIIDEEGINQQEITTMAGGERQLEALLGSSTIKRLSSDKRLRAEAGHDALEDVLITAAYLQRVTRERAGQQKDILPPVAESVLEAIGGSPKGAKPLVGKKATGFVSENRTGVQRLAGFIPDGLRESNFDVPKLVSGYFSTMRNLSPTEPGPMISAITDKGGILVNLQKTIPMLGNLRAFTELANPAHREAISAVYFDQEKDYRGFSKPNGFSKLVISPNRQGSWTQSTNRGPSQYVLSPFDYMASAAYLRWEKPQELQQDLEILHNLYHFITPFGGRARLEAKTIAPDIMDEESSIPKNLGLDKQWISVSSPINGQEKTVLGARKNMHEIYGCITKAMDMEGMMPAGKTKRDILQGGVDVVEQRPYMRIDRDFFLKAYANDKTGLRNLISQKQVDGVGGGFGGRAGGGGS